MSCFSQRFRKFYAGVMGLYTVIDVWVSCTLKAEDTSDGFMLRLRLILIHFLLHVSYGCGFIAGLIR